MHFFCSTLVKNAKHSELHRSSISSINMVYIRTSLVYSKISFFRLPTPQVGTIL